MEMEKRDSRMSGEDVGLGVERAREDKIILRVLNIGLA